MDIIITGRHCDIEDNMRAEIERKLEAALHVFPAVVRNARVVVTADKLMHTVEAIVELTTNKTIAASASDKDPLIALNLVEGKLGMQIRKVKERVESHQPKRRGHHTRRVPKDETAS